MVRAHALDGRTLGEIADALGTALGDDTVRTKGQAGTLLERALGADGGSAAAPDFPALGIELKTIPVGADRRPTESTFVCAIPMAHADEETWETSVLAAKLACVLWIPIDADGPPRLRRVRTPLLWRPTIEQTAVLRADFEELIGQIGAGAVETLSAHRGRWLQVRPKAATSRVRRNAPGDDGIPVETVPRGFYLRARFTGALLQDPAAVPE